METMIGLTISGSDSGYANDGTFGISFWATRRVDHSRYVVIFDNTWQRAQSRRKTNTSTDPNPRMQFSIL